MKTLKWVWILVLLGHGITGMANTSVDSLLTDAQENILMENYEAAIEDYSKGIFLDPNNIDCYLGRALAYIMTEEFTKAYEDIHLARLMNPADINLSYTIGMFEKRKDNLEEAINHFEKVLSKDPYHTKSIIELVDIYLVTGEKSKANSLIDFAISSNVGKSELYLYKGKVLHSMDRYEDAVEYISEALDRENVIDSSEYFMDLGSYHLKMNNLIDAHDAFSSSLEYDPLKMKAYYARGIVNFEMGNKSEALLDFDMTIDLANKPEEFFYDSKWNENNIIADTIVYDVVIKNPDTNDIYTSNALKYLRRKKYITEISNQVFTGKLDAHEYYSNKKLGVQEIKEIKKVFDLENVGMIKFEERWFFDEKSLAMEKKVISMVLGYEVLDTNGKIKGYKPYFKVYLN